MDIREAISTVAEGGNLSVEQMVSVMRTIMKGEATPAQIGGFLIAMRMKGETVEELSAAASVMRDMATPVELLDRNAVDTCGTGGDQASLFNVSTASALVVAAAGGHVAKHGNRSVSSSSGSADVLMAAGVKLDLPPERIGQCVHEIGVGFIFAPLHHAAMKHAIGPRKELATRTLFNLLGPLCNPAGVTRQVMGVFSDQWLRPLAEVLQRLGSEHVMVVHSVDGLDEISVAAPTDVAELRDGRIRTYRIAPEDFGLARHDLAELQVVDAAQSLAMIRQVFTGQRGAAHDMVVLNAAAALYVGGQAEDLAAGVRMAASAIESGRAQTVLDRLVEFSQGE